MPEALVTVVIPIYLEKPSKLEIISLNQILTVLHKHPITFVAPTGLDTAWYENYCQGKATIAIQRFTWKGHIEYGGLMLAPKFYRAFLNYEYILLCHLDAFVFRDELEKWCRQSYDYIGAVIYNSIWDSPPSSLHKLLGASQPEYYGNGGFALKKVETFYKITSKNRLFISLYHWVRKVRKQAFFDDLFMAQFFPRFLSSSNLPTQAVAQRFGAAYENWNEDKLPFTNREIDSLPFGIHGWIQFEQEYWKPCIQHYGHTI
jgi:hypothetical protein